MTTTSNVPNNSKERSLAVLSFGAVCCAVQGGSNSESVDAMLKCDHSSKSY